MSWESQEPIIQVLHTLGNPLRKAAIEALAKGEMRFSELLAACNMNYDHDAGHFYYHLSELMKKRIVKKEGSTYCITELGFKIAKMLRLFEKEFSFLQENADIEGETIKIEGVTVESLNKDEFLCLLGKDVSNEEAKLPQIEKERLEKFENWGILENGYRHHWLVARKDDEILGFIEYDCAIMSTVSPTKSHFVPRLLLTRLVILGFSFLHQRGEIAELLLTELMRQADNYEATSLEAININAEDEDLLSFFKKFGFERVSVGYNLRKVLRREPFGFDPTIDTTSISCKKCGSSRFRFEKKEEVEGKERVVYSCLECGEIKVVARGA